MIIFIITLIFILFFCVLYTRVYAYDKRLVLLKVYSEFNIKQTFQYIIIRHDVLFIILG